MPSPPAPFWKTKPFDQMSDAEWESLCDGCARCCLHKLEDDEDGKVYYTNVACRLLDPWHCRCTRYPERAAHVEDCIALERHRVRELHWLPVSCAYRLLAQGQPLPKWHPLKSGSPESVHQAGISVRGRVRTEASVDPERMGDHIITWVKS